ncbi:MAG: hypothetical protein ACI9LX_002184 [Paraglaciecola sp.]|jgi:hypothetical protein
MFHLLFYINELFFGSIFAKAEALVKEFKLRNLN